MAFLPFILALVLSVEALAQDPRAHHSPPPIPASVVERPITLRPGAGTVHVAVTTASKDAQVFYDQGTAYLHSYSWIDAARSFHQALRSDPALAMAHLGLSYAYAETAGPSAARDPLDRARALAAGASDREKRRIELRSLQLDAISAPEKNAAAKAAAYRRALDAALAIDPSDVELLLLRGMAEDPDPAGRGQGSTAGSVTYYQRALAVAPEHPGAHHYLVHAFENVDRIADALRHAETFARLAPAIAHAHHMYGHNLRRTGRMPAAIAEFRKAYELETDPARVAEVPPELDWHHQHNLDLLATAHQYVGQMKRAEELMRRSFAIATPLVVQEFNKREWPAFLLARGRLEEALVAANTLAAHPTPIVRGIGRITAGRVYLMGGRFKEAADAANAALADIRLAGRAAPLAAPDLAALQAEFYLRTGQAEKGRTMFRDVVKKLRAQRGPDAWSQALFRLEWIARVAADIGEWALAADVAREMRAHDPAYAGTHLALARVAEHARDRPTARRELELAAAAWSEADADLPELAQIQTRLAILRE